MASLLDLQRFAENKKAIEMEQNPMTGLFQGLQHGIMKRMEEIENQRRLAEEQARKQKIIDQFTSQDDLTTSGNVKQIAQGDNAKSIQRKVKVIPRYKKEVKVDMLNGDVSATLKQRDPIEILQDEVSAGYYQNPKDIVLRGIEIGADTQKAKELAVNYSAAVNQQQGQPQVPEGYQVSEYAPDDFGNMRAKSVRPVSPTDVKATRDMAREDKAEVEKSQATIDSAQSVINAIDNLKTNKVYFGPVGGRTPTWVSPLDSKKVDWKANFDYLSANNIKNVLSEMKSQSRTGATGFGQLNKEELRIIENASMKLKKEMDENTATKYLDEMRTAFQKIIDRERNGYSGEVGGREVVDVPANSGNFVEGKVYRDAQGNRALFQGGRFVPVQ